jgi:hypothetical protein
LTAGAAKHSADLFGGAGDRIHGRTSAINIRVCVSRVNIRKSVLNDGMRDRV